jgi:hypothetical protein
MSSSEFAAMLALVFAISFLSIKAVQHEFNRLEMYQPQIEGMDQ